jgi:hypothetical protein
VNLESCLLVFGNWFGITEMATDRKVKYKKCTKTAKELSSPQSGTYVAYSQFVYREDTIARK